MPLDTISMLRCRAAGHAYCVDLDQVAGIERGDHLQLNPEPSGPMGWILSRDHRVPVLDLAERLGSGPRALKTGKVVLMRGDRPWALAVDDVERFERASSSEQPIPVTLDGPLRDCFDGVVLDGDSLLLRLAPDRLRPDACPGPRARPLPPAAPTRAAASAPTPATSVMGRLLIFAPPNRPSSAGGIRIGLSYTQVLEIASGLSLSRVPAAPGYVLGVAAWRSQAVTVLDAGRLLGMNPLAGIGESRLVVARSARWRALVALPVGGRVQTQLLPLPHAACSLPSGAEAAMWRAVVEIEGGRFLGIPDLDTMAAPPEF